MDIFDINTKYKMLNAQNKALITDRLSLQIKAQRINALLEFQIENDKQKRWKVKKTRKQEIENYIKKHDVIKISNLTNYFEINPRTIRNYVRQLVIDNKIKRVGIGEYSSI